MSHGINLIVVFSGKDWFKYWTAVSNSVERMDSLGFLSRVCIKYKFIRL